MTQKDPHEHVDDLRTVPTVWLGCRSTELGFAVSCIVAALTLSLDLSSKQLALRFLATDDRVPVLGDLLGLQLAFNIGAIFSLGSELAPMITVLGLASAVLLTWAATRPRHIVEAVAIGNLLDRVISPQGFGRGAVIDFLMYGHFFISNIADVAIGSGALFYLLAAWRNHVRSTCWAHGPRRLRAGQATAPRLRADAEA
ncbi:signal peptidase II [Leucobacter sp. wl10]|uniref:signal peptidase II n=1 Tax=Leucobacter sp. wl10 TaxID=2304677 RepID=UPI000E5A6905|nr:signal peptidase II [Leucobacter sp. wl10]RGE19059.1 lipoprotein signal peptidase [Leucobacter sp. wl10]